jgi:SAM-dependent methyltransferase/uncharacterized protein YbaR (Trm112 family)
VTEANAVDLEVLEIAACPCDHTALVPIDGELSCEQSHRFPVLDGVPVLLAPGAQPTLPDVFRSTQDIVADGGASAIRLSDAEEFVASWIIKTNGNLYRGLSGPLPRYPIPVMPIEPRGQELLVDLGGNWGRWAIAAALAGFRPIVVDPNLEAVLVGRHVAGILKVNVRHIVGDARRLPLRHASVDTVFSYSVLQHFSKEDVASALEEIKRVLQPTGRSVLQMANIYGIRQATNLARQRIVGSTNPFRVRYWTPEELVRVGSATIGPSSIAVDGYFSLNARPEDRDLLPPIASATVAASQAIKRVGCKPGFRWLRRFADSLWLLSRCP